ncbi:hypothetical protein IMSAGC022_00765 [Alistipes sp.]|nr:hypothetical protein IMSAGC022_00765 [Alistipes sp.]
MRAVTHVAVAVPCDVALTGNEVIAVLVVGIAVAVVILAVGAVELGVIDPHVVFQILVRIHHTLVDHGHDDARIARSELPCLEEVDVGTLLGLCAERTVVHVVPLRRELRVVERHIRATRLCHLVAGYGGAALHALDIDVVLHAHHLAYLGQQRGHLFKIGAPVERESVPLVQSRTARSLLGAPVDGEDALDTGSTDGLHYLVDALDARTGCRSLDDICGLGSEFHDHTSFARALCRVYYLRTAAARRFARRTVEIVRTGTRKGRAE